MNTMMLYYHEYCANVMTIARLLKTFQDKLYSGIIFVVENSIDFHYQAIQITLLSFIRNL